MLDADRRRAVVASPEREEQEGFKEQAATALRLARALDESNPLVEEHFAVADASWKAVQALWASEAEEKERSEAADAWAEASGLTDCEWHRLVSEPQSPQPDRARLVLADGFFGKQSKELEQQRVGRPQGETQAKPPAPRPPAHPKPKPGAG